LQLKRAYDDHLLKYDPFTVVQIANTPKEALDKCIASIARDENIPTIATRTEPVLPTATSPVLVPPSHTAKDAKIVQPVPIIVPVAPSAGSPFKQATSQSVLTSFPAGLVVGLGLGICIGLKLVLNRK
jgi:hypothetical protein